MTEETQYDVFLSHNSDDKEAVEIIAHKLRDEAKLHPFLDKWHLIPGEPWQEVLEEALERSETVAVFVGPSGISPWHNEEMRAALDHAVRTRDEYRVIPVLLPGATESAVTRFLARRTWVDFRSGLDDPDAFNRLVAGVLGQPPEKAGPFTLPDEPAPYPGLLPFTAQQVDLFFGRTEEKDKLLVQVRKSSFVAVVGGSGSGKSSLVLAGLLPALDKDWHALVLVPGARPLHALANQIATHGPSGRRLYLADDIETRLADRTDGLGTAVSTLLADHPDISTLLIAVDQFEELFTQVAGKPDEVRRQQHQFIANLMDTVRTSGERVRVVLTLRADFIKHCLDFPDLRALLEPNQLLLGPMGEEALREAIIKPAQVVGAMFEKGLVSRLLEDMHDQPAALPLMQFALAQLWQKRHGVWLTHTAYEAIDGVSGALDQRADAMYSQLTDTQKLLARNMFVRLVALGEGTSNTGRRVRRDELHLVGAAQEEVDNLIGILSHRDVRLIAADANTVELAHEALIEQWGQLRDWLEEDREALRIHRRLTETASEWEDNNRDESYLYRGARLAEAEEWAETHSEEMNVLERKFLETSLILREQEAAEKEVQRQRELEAAEAKAREQEQAKVAAKLRRLAVLLASVGVVAIVLTIIIFVLFRRTEQARKAAEAAQRRAEHESRVALVYQLASQALENLESRPQRSLLLAVEAISTTLEADGLRIAIAEKSLHQVLAATGGIPFSGHEAGVSAVAFSPDGRWLATAGRMDSIARLWDVTDPTAPPVVLHGHEDTIRAVAFSPDGRWLATGSEDNTARLWDVTNPTAEPIVLRGHESAVSAVAFSPDGHWLATGSWDNTARLWDMTNLKAKPIVLSEHEGDVGVLAFSPDGHWLATASPDNTTVQLWDVTDPAAPPVVLRGHEGWVLAVAFSPDGRWLATGSLDNTARLWDMTNLKAEPIVLSGHEGWVLAVAFSPDGHWLATAGSFDNTVRLWDVTNPAAPPVVLRGHEGEVGPLAFSPDGRWLATGSLDNTVRLWDVTDPAALPVVLRGHEGYVWVLAFSPDGHWLATGSEDETARLWDVTDPVVPAAKPAVLRGHAYDVWAVAFSPDGHWLATAGSLDNTARLWDVTNPVAPPVVLRGHEGGVWVLAFSPDGRWLATGGGHNTAQLWDVTNPAASPVVLRVHEDDHLAEIVWAVAFSPDGRWLATGSGDNTARLWDVTNPAALPIVLRGHEYTIRAVAFSPDGRWLATGSGDNTARLWDVTNPTAEPIVLRGHESAVSAVAFSPDGRWLATGGGDNTARLWYVTDPASLPVILRGHEAGVSTVAFSPDGRWLATGSEDNTARLWDVTDLAAPLVVLRGHEGYVWALAFSPDGRWLATGRGDNTARLWDVTDPASPPVILRGHEDTIRAVAFSPDGRWLATGSGDNTARLWRVQLDDLIALACRTAGRNLTEEEWQHFLSERPYRKTCPSLPGPEESPTL